MKITTKNLTELIRPKNLGQSRGLGNPSPDRKPNRKLNPERISIEDANLFEEELIQSFKNKSTEIKSLVASSNILDDDFFRDSLKNIRIILLQHMLTDTEEFIELLHSSGATIQAIFGKPNSCDSEVVKRLESKYYVRVNEYCLYDETDYLLDYLRNIINLCKMDNSSILILEVGGYFVKPLSRLDQSELKFILGTVEVTTFGHNRYQKSINEVNIPVYSVARSSIKEVEAKHVAHAVLEGTNKAMREIKRSVRNSTGLMIGYGMIGRSVVKAMRNWGIIPIVFDKSYGKLLEAFHDDHNIVLELEHGLSKADFIFSSTGNRGLFYDQMLLCKNGVVLVSAGSRTNEFDTEELDKRCIEKYQISKNITSYLLENKKTIYLVNKGKAVNFLVGSCPDEIVDLIFAEILVNAKKLCNKSEKKKLNIINESTYHDIEDVAKAWLKPRL
jgi:adenosylhomocysteinase